MSEDPRLEAARYRAARAARADTEQGEDAVEASGDPAADAPEAQEATAPTAHDRALYVETAIQQAIRRGDFDDLPGAGKPLEGLGDRHDPDWWIRRKIQTEKLTGLGPPALMLRTEAAEFEDRLDALTRAADVRAHVEDFNRRVVDARRQLLGGPPVVTPTRDPEADVVAWEERRAARAAAARRPEASPPRRRGLFRRR